MGILWPAVLKSGHEDEEEGGEEIDQEKFLKVKGREGLENLVGVGRKDQEMKEGWKFWRVA